MGSGAAACEESEAVVELTEQLMESGFSLEGTVKSINSVLLLREGEQCPATLDLHCLNLYTGDLSSRKQGAAATFIKRGEKVTVLESADMPIGWNRNVTGGVGQPAGKGDLRCSGHGRRGGSTPRHR